MNKKVVFQNFVHHLNAQPLEIIGQWHVFNAEDIPANWPTEKTQLAISVNDLQIQYLRENITEMPIVQEELPQDPVEDVVDINSEPIIDDLPN